MRVQDTLYPSLAPFDQRMLDVGDGHQIYVEQSGNPDAPAVIVLHGGPGGGSSPAMRRFFDPRQWRVILFDQRGCGKSRPHAEVRANTSWHLVADIELIRARLKIDQWVVFGGSWGATLALIYAQAHPSAVRHMVLRGVFLARRAELEWFYGGGAARFWPDLWQRFIDPIPSAEHDDLIAAYHRRLFCGDIALETRLSQAWVTWESALATVADQSMMVPAGLYSRAFARLETHYFVNGAFLPHDGALLEGMGRIEHIPGTIVQGRMDMICPPISAWDLAERWPAADLRMVPASGHALSEPAIARELVQAMQRLAR